MSTKFTRTVWNLAVTLVVVWLLNAHRYWLFILPYKCIRDDIDFPSIVSIMNGPIYFLMYIAWGLLCSTAYNEWSKARTGLLVAMTAVPLLGMVFVKVRADVFAPSDYVVHGGLLLFASLIVLCTRHSLPQLLLGMLKGSGRLLGLGAKKGDGSP